MKKFDFFGPFRTVKTDFQTNFLLFLTLYAFVDMLLFGKMMFGFFLINLVIFFWLQLRTSSGVLTLLESKDVLFLSHDTIFNVVNLQK